MPDIRRTSARMRSPAPPSRLAERTRPCGAEWRHELGSAAGQGPRQEFQARTAAKTATDALTTTTQRSSREVMALSGGSVTGDSPEVRQTLIYIKVALSTKL